MALQYSQIKQPESPTEILNKVQIYSEREYVYLFNTLSTIILDTTDNRTLAEITNQLLPDLYSLEPVLSLLLIYNTYIKVCRTLNIDIYDRVERLKSTKSQTKGWLGRSPFSEEELSFIFTLTNIEEYQHSIGANKGKPNWEVICNVVNIIFGNDRVATNLSAEIKSVRSIIRLGDSNGETFISDFFTSIIEKGQFMERYGDTLQQYVTDVNSTLSYGQIASILMPDQVEEYGLEACIQIVYVMVDLLKQRADFDLEKFTVRCQRIRGDRNRSTGNFEKILNGTRYSRSEIRLMYELKRQGLENDEIAETLNNRFHGGQQVRTKDKVRHIINSHIKKSEKYPLLYPNPEDSNVNIEAIVNAFYPEEYNPEQEA